MTHQSQSPQFAVFLSPARPGMPDDPTEAEAQAVSQHLAYYQGLLQSRSLILAGRTTEPPHLGVMIFAADSLEDAARVANEDPAVSAGVFTIRVQPFRIALLRDPDCNPRSLAAGLFNRCWQLLETPDRSPEQTDELVHSVHASALHWLTAGGPTQACQAHWMCARVWSAVGQGHTALFHAQRCRELAEQHALAPFEAALAHEAAARALLALGQPHEAKPHLDKLRAARDDSHDNDIREVLTRDLDELESMIN